MREWIANGFSGWWRSGGVTQSCGDRFVLDCEVDGKNVIGNFSSLWLACKIFLWVLISAFIVGRNEGFVGRCAVGDHPDFPRTFRLSDVCVCVGISASVWLSIDENDDDRYRKRGRFGREKNGYLVVHVCWCV